MTASGSTFEDLREDFARAFDAIGRNATAQREAFEALAGEQERLWRDLSDLRDEVHEGLAALANRMNRMSA